jgi:hypothetical protein
LETSSQIGEKLKYASGAMGLIDHNPGKNRHHRKRIGSTYTEPRDRILGRRRQDELTRLFHQVGPYGFLVLSGLQRRGGKIIPVLSKVASRFMKLREAQLRAKSSRAHADQAIREAKAAVDRQSPTVELALMHARIWVTAADFHERRAQRVEAEISPGAKGRA